MKKGIIGSNTVGKTLATKLAEKDDVVLVADSRGLAGSLAASGAWLTPSSTLEALACDLVFLAVSSWTKVWGVLGSGNPQDGRILVDTANIFPSYPFNARIDDLKGDSGSEIIARLAPTACVTKALNTLPFAKMSAPLPEGMKGVLFVAGDHAPAVKTATDLITELGLHLVPLGSLAVAGRRAKLDRPAARPGTADAVERRT